MRVLIFDPVNPKPYTSDTLRREPLGGTEATVIRVAEQLDALVMQHNRTQDEGRYRAPSSQIDPTHLIVLRTPLDGLKIMERYPKAKKFLWIHDLPGPGTEPGQELRQCASQLAAARVTIVCVSDFQANEARRSFVGLPASRCPKVARVYNPIDVSLSTPERQIYDPNKLVFFSSPHKGLEYTLGVFAELYRSNEGLRLYVANPGYRLRQIRNQPGVINLGPVPHHVIIEHVRGALCTFYPNYVYPETFGLVLAESNAVGTPVLTHRLGAATEVLEDNEQFLEAPWIRGPADRIFRRFPFLREPGERVLIKSGYVRRYAERLRAWQSGGRPKVVGRPQFALSAVAQSWRELLAIDW